MGDVWYIIHKLIAGSKEAVLVLGIVWMHDRRDDNLNVNESILRVSMIKC